MAERNASTGYMALGKQTNQTTAVTPAIYVPYYKQNLMTDTNLNEDTPIIGNRFKTLQSLQGTRKHKGTITAQAEVNTLAYWCDMLLSKSSTTGAGPYTHVFGLSNNTDPNSYTVDICEGVQVVRYIGVQASKMTPTLNNETWQLEMAVSAISTFYGREIASVSTTTLTLKTEYDATPTTGLVASDLVRVIKADGSGSPLDTTVSSVTATTVVLAASAAAFSAGDMIVLRPATPTYTLQLPLIWGKTQLFFAADAATALTNSATVSNQTRVEKGTSLSINFPFEKDDGSDRSGGFDPASLIRTVGDSDFKMKRFFDSSEEIKYWLANTKRALLIRMYAGTTNQYEFRITMNNLRGKPSGVPTETGGVIYQEIDYASTYDQTDGQGMLLTVIDATATV